MSVKNRNSVVTDGLVFYVDAGNEDSYPGSGTTWYNLAGSNNGTLTNGPTYSSANGGSIVFDGTNDHVVLDEDIDVSEFTVMATFSISSYANNWAMFFGNTNTNSFFAFQYNSRFRLQSEANTNNDLVYTSNLADGIHVLQAAKSSGGSTIWYLDGQSIGSSTLSGADQQFIFNRMVFYSTGNSLGIWSGNYYMASIYNRALSADELTQNYNALKNRFI